MIISFTLLNTEKCDIGVLFKGIVCEEFASPIDVKPIWFLDVRVEQKWFANVLTYCVTESIFGIGDDEKMAISHVNDKAFVFFLWDQFDKPQKFERKSVLYQKLKDFKCITFCEK